MSKFQITENEETIIVEGVQDVCLAIIRDLKRKNNDKNVRDKMVSLYKVLSDWDETARISDMTTIYDHSIRKVE